MKARPTGASAERPPHPAIPAPLVEPEPTRETLASSAYRWLPGHWIWTGNGYEWQSGLWIYDLPGYALAPPQWFWDGYEWLFVDAGWALPGTSSVVYQPTAVPTDAADDALAFDGSAPAEPSSSNAVTPDVYVEVRSYPAYTWPGYWIAPPIVYPIWHPYYHYYWHHHHQPQARPPEYRDGRYEYARRHSDPHGRPTEQQRQAWARVNHRPELRPPARRGIPDAVRTRALSSGHLDPAALRNPGDLDPTALQATPEQRAIREQADPRPAVYGVPVRASGKHAPDELTRPLTPGARRSLPSTRPGSHGPLPGSAARPPHAPAPRAQAPAAPSRAASGRPVPAANGPGLTSVPRPSLPQATQQSGARLPSPKATPTSRPAPSTSRPRVAPTGRSLPSPTIRRASPP
jgi:hypothetical protein